MADDSDFELYRYTPSLAAAAVSAAVFAILTALHSWRLLRVRAYYFTPFTIGGICKSQYLALPYTHPRAVLVTRWSWLPKLICRYHSRSHWVRWQNMGSL